MTEETTPPHDFVWVSRKIARQALGALMSDISEDCWRAGWLSGNGAALWRLMEAGGGRYGQGIVTTEQAAEMRLLSEALGEWMEWDDEAGDVLPVPLPEWRALMQESADAE